MTTVRAPNTSLTRSRVVRAAVPIPSVVLAQELREVLGRLPSTGRELDRSLAGRRESKMPPASTGSAQGLSIEVLPVPAEPTRWDTTAHDDREPSAFLGTRAQLGDIWVVHDGTRPRSAQPNPTSSARTRRVT